MVLAWAARPTNPFVRFFIAKCFEHYVVISSVVLASRYVALSFIVMSGMRSSALQSQMAATAYFPSKQLLGISRQCTLNSWTPNHPIVTYAE